MIREQLRFEKFKKQDPVKPGNAEFQSYIKKPFLLGISKLRRILEPAYLIHTVQLDNGVFQEGTGVAMSFLLAFYEFLAALFGFGKAYDVQQFAIETLVQAVAVIGKRKLQQMFGREQFVECY